MAQRKLLIRNPSLSAALFLAWIVIVCALIVSRNPGLLDRHASETLRAFRAQAKDLPALRFPGIPELPARSLPSFQYRGDPSREGRSAVILPIKLREVWRSEPLNDAIHTASKASPAADVSGVYVGDDTGWFQAFSLDGKLLWRFAFSHAFRGVHGTAALDQDSVYIGAYNGRFYRLRKADGTPLWSVPLADAVGSSPLIESGASPGAIYVSGEFNSPRAGILAKLDRASGQTLWKNRIPGDQIHSSPCLDALTRRVYLGANDGNLHAFDADTGAPLWSVQLGGAIKSTPACVNEKVYVTSWGKRFSVIDGIRGRILWDVPLAGISQSSPALTRDGRYAVILSHRPSKAYGVDLRQRKIAWTRELEGTNAIGSVALSKNTNGGETAWFSCASRTLCAVAPESGRILAKLPIPGELTGVPTLTESGLWLSLDSGPLVHFR